MKIPKLKSSISKIHSRSKLKVRTVLNFPILTLMIFAVATSFILVSKKDTSLKESEASELHGNLSGTTKIDGTFYTFGDDWINPTSENVVQFMDEMHELQMNTIIIGDLVRKTPDSGCSSNSFTWNNNYQSILQTIFSKAEDYNIDVYVGLVWSTGCKDWNFFADPNKSTIINLLKDSSNSKNPISFVINNYGNNSRFKGWYLTEEPGLTVFENTDGMLDYWAQLTNAVKAHSNKPVLAAPSLCGVDGILQNPPITPEEVGRRALRFKQRTGVDIQIWQDCVNQTGIAITKDNVGNRHLTGEYYYAISQAIGSQNVWADIEIGNCCMYPSMKGGAYYPAALEKVNNQIKQGRNGPSKVITWFNQGQLTKVARGHMSGSDRLYVMYQTLFGLTDKYTLPKPDSYTWVTSPSSTYPDTDNKELFDKKIGEYKNFGGVDNASDSKYVGILGPAEVNLDFGKVIRPVYIGAHVINKSAGSILFPKNIIISCSQNNSQWQPLGTYPLKVERFDSEFVIANDEHPISGKSCRYIKVRLDNDSGAWTFVSEIEVVADAEKTTPTATKKMSPTSTLTVTSKPSSTSIPSSYEFDTADIDRDGQITINDFSYFAKFYSMRDIKGDMNKDNKVDFYDYLYFHKSYMNANN